MWFELGKEITGERKKEKSQKVPQSITKIKWPQNGIISNQQTIARPSLTTKEFSLKKEKENFQQSLNDCHQQIFLELGSMGIVTLF